MTFDFPKSILWAGFLLILWQPVHAGDLSLDEIDRLFSQLESNPSQFESYSDQIELLKQNIAPDDIPRTLRLKRALCWATDLTQDNALEQGLNYANEQLLLPMVQADIPTQSDLILCRGWLLQEKGIMADAMSDYNRSVALAYQSEEPRLIADSRSLRGALLSYQGNFADALEDLITSQHLYESLNLTYWARYNLLELATSYRRFGDPATAIRYYEDLLQKYTEIKDKFAIVGVKAEMAMAYETLEDFDKALIYYREVLASWSAQNDPVNTAATRVNMSGTLIKLGRLKEAKAELELAFPDVKPEHVGFYAFKHLFMAQILLAEGKPLDALPLLEIGEESFRNVQNNRGLAELYATKSQVYAALEDWANAFYSLEVQNALHTQLDSQLQSQRTTEMRTRFDTDRIENENRQLIAYQRLREKEMVILQENKFLQFIIIVMGIIILSIVSIFAYKQAQRSKLMERLALTDHLTQLANRRHTYHEGEAMFRGARPGSPLSVILFDADHFKKINDHFGHDVGDKVLIAMAQSSVGQMRKGDLVGRIGGEEFLALLPHTTLEQAVEIAERLRLTIETTDLSDIASGLGMSISAGVATLDSSRDKNFSSFLNRADHALYRAKHNGRNRVEKDD
ncbi:diguanylate cyclase [Shewanella sp. FJAT-52076]|uniref:tetratricopeptide repeat-containing diguanylate cyclase n=1 Tax=Shewanella sp. FJAT-52076 TaxID=2864202 RepID=UPI001C65F261|nr:diguanylate cyclase [Shewanella sp. FJAT-52076]QYJ74413.1 GGDEF domain-containing protein [Shewanella sp. FJAT-52076]